MQKFNYRNLNDDTLRFVVLAVCGVPGTESILIWAHRWDGEINICSNIEVQDVACVGVSHEDDCVCVHAPEVLDG